MDCKLRHWLVTQSFNFLTESLCDKSTRQGLQVEEVTSMHSCLGKVNQSGSQL
jgi:hypothetical protein